MTVGSWQLAVGSWQLAVGRGGVSQFCICSAVGSSRILQYASGDARTVKKMLFAKMLPVGAVPLCPPSVDSCQIFGTPTLSPNLPLGDSRPRPSPLNY
ncbi:MAG: hypothetical protein EAZ90_23505 [Oscillatoriales cyanobacterium]|nr:MAG: hypothetical protein EAZ94_31880 [Oscillatoriales cyanobacterium]TAE19232.1 MAG: hypothetical protein EAZ93_27745 [Oscillatoriales cyanobacterium]TAE39201.1 MAG: hypothetical protein EAZ90_23505 [Oscillatoriales cyanobacterium]TAE50214.1 MAG: hypothetical protein EAZ88_21045 [Oscillatoriales cyanobacterium]TAE65040.1 MAG: hypothetical protein EAZ86_25610 [Oscillatoriales cyanobacterium]